jgi:hypothetical protein
MMADKIDPPDDDNAARDRRVYIEEMSRLQDTIAGLQADNWRLVQKAERDKPPEVWLSLKAAIKVARIDVLGFDIDRSDAAPLSFDDADQRRKSDEERVRRWCELGTIVAEKRGGRWFVRMDSLNAYLAGLRGK